MCLETMTLECLNQQLNILNNFDETVSHKCDTVFV